MRVGGSFTYPPTQSPSHDSLLLIAGGVGINPHLSILSWLSQNPDRRKHLNHVQLLYASKWPELAFCDRLEVMKSFLDSQLYLTDATDEVKLPLNVHRRRIEDYEVVGHVQVMAKPLVYICGPTQMTDHLEELLSRSREQGGAGLDKDRIQLEKWW